jgi:hypothetical protein
MKTEEIISKLSAENKKMKELIEFANSNLSGLFNSMDRMDKNEVKDAIRFIGIEIENFINKRM